MKYTIAHLAISATPQETVTAAGLAGFERVGIRICGRYVGDDGFVNAIGNPQIIAEIRARLAEHGTTLSNVSAYQFYPGLNVSHLERIVETTCMLGAPTIVVNSFMEDTGMFEDMFARYAELAAECDITLALEFLPYSRVKTIEDAIGITRKCGMDNVGILVDALHLDRSGGNPDALRRLRREEIVFAQICDAGRRSPGANDDDLMREARTARLPLGTGNLPLFGFMDALPDDVELEYEVANAADRHMSPLDRARNARRDMESFLRSYRCHKAEHEDAT